METVIFIPIEKDTIRPNPTAGRTTYYLPGPQTITFTCYGELPDYLVQKNVVVTGINYGQPVTIEGQIIRMTAELANAVSQDRSGRVKIQMTTAAIEVNSIPEPSYLFSYKDPLATCENCLLVSPVSRFDADLLYGEYDSEYAENYVYVCPHCGHRNTFELLYEKVSDVLSKNNP